MNTPPNYRRRKARRALRSVQHTKPAAAARPEPLPPRAPAAAAPPPAQIPDLSELTRAGIMSQLDDLDVTYNKRAPRAALAAQLWTALMVEG